MNECVQCVQCVFVFPIARQRFTSYAKRYGKIYGYANFNDETVDV